MFRTAPRLLALLVSSVCLLAKSAGAQPIGGIDSPVDGQTVSGIVRVSGFVLDLNTVSKVELAGRRRSDQCGRPEHPAARRSRDLPDLLQQRDAPRLPDVVPGAGTYSDGPHSLSIRVTESVTQDQFVIGSVTVIVDNGINQAPFGFIDIPGPAGLEGANGSFTVAGWAVDDVDIDHIDFLVDGRVVAGAVGRGAAVHGELRVDPSGRGGRLPRRASGALLWLRGQHRHVAVHQRNPQPHGPRHGRRGRDPGDRRANRPDRQQRPEPGAVRADRLPARQGVALLRHERRRGSFALLAERLLPGGLQRRGRLGARRRILARPGPGVVRRASPRRPDRREHPQRLHADRRRADQLLRHQPAGRGSQLLGLRQRRQRRMELLVLPRARRRQRPDLRPAPR